MTKKSRHKIKTVRQVFTLLVMQAVFLVGIIVFVQNVLADAFAYLPIDSRMFSTALAIMLGGMILIDCFKQLNRISRKNKKKAKKTRRRKNK